VIVAAIAILQLKSCVLTVWGPPKETTRYAIEGGDRRTLEIYLFPDHRAIFWHTDPDRGFTEGSLVHLRGNVGTHYFGRLWHLDGPGVIFGYRLYPTGCEPVMMEIETLSHYQVGPGDAQFPRSKDRTDSIFRFCQDRLGFQTMELHAVPVDAVAAEKKLQVFAVDHASPQF
jgi:hypothetical protein